MLRKTWIQASSTPAGSSSRQQDQGPASVPSRRDRSLRPQQADPRPRRSVHTPGAQPLSGIRRIPRCEWSRQVRLARPARAAARSVQRLERRAALGAVLLATLAVLGCGLPIRTSHPDPAVDLLAEFPELAEWGDVIMIGGVEYWKPYLVRDAFHSSWEPYANGYLYDDEVDGLVWVSQDPWGFITEHYGYWRHHERYGFVWRPLYPIAWRPYVATIFYDGSGAIHSWCPFSSEVWDLGLYVDDYGFDDYYWAPFWALADTPDFYPWFVSHCGGYPVPVTIYEPETYSRDQPEQCYRRQRDYRQRREVERGRGLEVVDRLPAQRAEPPQAPRTRSADPAPAAPPEGTPTRGVSINPVPREILVPKRRSQEPQPPPQDTPPFEMPARLPAQPQPAPALPRPRTEPVTPTPPPAAPAPAFSPAQRAPAVASPPRPEPAPTPLPPLSAAPGNSFAPAQRALAAASSPRREPAPAPPPSAAPPSYFTPAPQAPAATRESPPSAAPAPASPPPAAAPSTPPAAVPAAPSPPPEIRPAEASRPAAPSFSVDRLRRIDAPKLTKNDGP